MTWVSISLSAGTLLGMAVVLTYILGWANKAFQVQTDPRVDAVKDVLPGANCGGCGFVGCGEYAEAVVLEEATVDRCTVGGSGCAAAVAAIMGVEVSESHPYRPIVHCGAGYEERLLRHPYRGEARCQAANLVTDVQGCIYGCLGFGDCTRNRLVFVGKPTEEDVAAVKEAELPEVATADFKTTVDDTEWRG